MRLIVSILVLMFLVSGCSSTDPRKKTDKASQVKSAVPAEEILYVQEEDAAYVETPVQDTAAGRKKTTIKGETLIAEEAVTVTAVPTRIKGEDVVVVEDDITAAEGDWVK